MNCDLTKCQSCDDLQSCDDMRNELNAIKKLCAKHERLYRKFSSWKNSIAKNDCQLEILNDTAAVLRARQEILAETLALRRGNPELLQQLQKDIQAVENQVDIWMRDLAEISSDRTNLDIELIQLRCKLQRSMTNIELAHIDFEMIEEQHRDIWRRFLYELPKPEKRVADITELS
ncbi:unnamed protein product [Bursaphelenchus okinawaensis]|uniref:Uncharacterized protein n=1 Tax=Bursaphelenchus okinawaensis TaxID=465554 RepID=A0A811KI62_9BILA|nr:unnamed protein product [Bursaphelenchus okinawaensis]CAG9103479.1 unnamed protein product [Bursaphelenchus okinawaensis]